MINKIKELLKDNKMRHIITAAIILPFVIVIVIFGVKIYKQAKDLISLAGDNSVAVNDNYSINGGSFVLRANATDVQKEYFAELKNIYENPSSSATEEEKAISTVKNFVADFYTWSNKQGQYDVGGTYYLFEPQRQTIYIQARDQFYKYINEYINEYGASNLLEVESVEANTVGNKFGFIINENDEEVELGAWNISATWTYSTKEGSGFDSSKYQTSSYFTVIDHYGRYEIAFMGSKEYSNNEE